MISVDAKKKELVGDFNNGGHEWQPAGHPERDRLVVGVRPEPGGVAVEPVDGREVVVDEGHRRLAELLAEALV